MTVAPERPVALKRGRDLVTPELFAQLTDFCAEEYGQEPCVAERVIDQALAMCHTMGVTQSGDTMAPSQQVDAGWHTFMLHTEAYAAWCQESFGYFLHHQPNSKVRTRGLMTNTVDKIRAQGFEVDEGLWGTAADCNPPTCCGDGPCC
ncbi:hypothetical protein ACQEV9_18390 [Streptomyces chartreusis]|uniref:hypothetical protein n=1 Tax=Streptomyces chartreusis TaxID=1969 RepID=UPI003D8AE9D2